MQSGLSIGAGVTTVMGFMGLVAVLYYRYERNKSNSQLENLKALPEQDRAKHLDTYLTRYELSAKSMDPERNFQLIQKEMENKHRQIVLRQWGFFIAMIVFFVLTAILAGLEIYQRGNRHVIAPDEDARLKVLDAEVARIKTLGGEISSTRKLVLLENEAEPAIDYANSLVPGEAGCGSETLDEVVKDNIIASSSNGQEPYGKAGMRPNAYGSEASGVKIEANPTVSPTAYTIRTAKGDSCNTGNHGGFLYNIDAKQTPIKNRYRVSFCARSNTPEKIGLLVQHTRWEKEDPGKGELSCLTGVAVLTGSPKRYTWECELSGLSFGKDGRQANIPMTAFLGYLYDYINKRACVNSKMNPDDPCAGNSFVIWQFRLERVSKK